MKNSKKILLLLSTVIILGSVFHNGISAQTNTLNVDEGEKEEIYKKIEALLRDRASVMISDKKLSCENQFKIKNANLEEERLRAQIAQFREDLKNEGETYSSTRTSVDIIGFEEVSEVMISVHVKEETYLTIAETGIETGYSAEHTVIFEKNGDNWEIIKDKQLEPGGLLPLNAAVNYVEYERQ